ncbi:hypothetical protein GCM10010252_27370 [Streptomyces aureoverticillatus]|nr:hypothetical protein GCM10010252_27370 [Streptomyces aureoverticillatus]
MNTLTHKVMVALAAVGMTVCMATNATADTNKNQQTSIIDGGALSLLSATPQGGTLQTGQQTMTKKHTVNNSLIDYIELPSTHITSP